MGMNPAAIMKLMSAKNKFTSNHPKFSAFLNAVFSRGIEEGTKTGRTAAHIKYKSAAE